MATNISFQSEVLMRLLTGTLLVSMLALATPFSAQAAEPRTAEQLKASYDAHKGDFDYLLGDWEFSAVSKRWGKFKGYWSAVRLAVGAQVLDEFRPVDDQGNEDYTSTTLRVYNAYLDRWELITAEIDGGLQDVGTARRVGSEMHIEQKFDVASGHPSLWRIRYYNIQSDRFSWAGDRSEDGGKTWEKDFLQIEARRIGPPRALGPLAGGKKP
jgi:hypothetical protein